MTSLIPINITSFSMSITFFLINKTKYYKSSEVNSHHTLVTPGRDKVVVVVVVIVVVVLFGRAAEVTIGTISCLCWAVCVV